LHLQRLLIASCFTALNCAVAALQPRRSVHLCDAVARALITLCALLCDAPLYTAGAEAEAWYNAELKASEAEVTTASKGYATATDAAVLQKLSAAQSQRRRSSNSTSNLAQVVRSRAAAAADVEAALAAGSQAPAAAAAVLSDAKAATSRGGKL
jgi:hypothetical protein